MMLPGFPIAARGGKQFSPIGVEVWPSMLIPEAAFGRGPGLAALVIHIESFLFDMRHCLSPTERNLTAANIAPRLACLAEESDEGAFFEEFSTARILDPDVEIEFRAVGHPGTYVHRVRLSGPMCLHQVVPIPRATFFAVDRINEAILAELAADPGALDRLHHREFEHVVARLVERMGYQVELTRAAGDDGVDIFAVHRGGLAPWLTVIDCKHRGPAHRFGPDIVRMIAGIRDQHNASTGMIVTTARFTQGAWDLQRERWPREVALADRDRVVQWLSHYGWTRRDGLWIPDP